MIPSPINPHPCDRDAHARREDGANRSEPLATGRRDPHRGPDRYTAMTPDAARAASYVSALRALWRRAADDVEREALEVAAQVFAGRP